VLNYLIHCTISSSSVLYTCQCLYHKLQVSNAIVLKTDHKLDTILSSYLYHFNVIFCPLYNVFFIYIVSINILFHTCFILASSKYLLQKLIWIELLHYPTLCPEFKNEVFLISSNITTTTICTETKQLWLSWIAFLFLQKDIKTWLCC
jgi:hypothetical protein